MSKNDDVGLSAYYLAFKGVYAVCCAAIGLIPVASHVILTGILFPPLGSITVAAQVLWAAFAGALTYVVYKRQRTSERKTVWTSMALIAVSLFAFGVYMWSLGTFVRSVPDQGDFDHPIRVSVGLQKSTFSNTNMPGKSDVRMLTDRGVEDAQVFEMWTPRSVVEGRIVLFIAFCGITLPLLGILSFAAIDHARQSSAK